MYTGYHQEENSEDDQPTNGKSVQIKQCEEKACRKMVGKQIMLSFESNNTVELEWLVDSKARRKRLWKSG